MWQHKSINISQIAADFKDLHTKKQFIIHCWLYNCFTVHKLFDEFYKYSPTPVSAKIKCAQFGKKTV